MRLLVKRDLGKKGGLFGGKQLFQITLKLELTPEEQATVERFVLQDLFFVTNPVESKHSFTYQDFMSGKTLADTDLGSLLLQYKLYGSALEAANSALKNYQLFPGEDVVEIQ